MKKYFRLFPLALVFANALHAQPTQYFISPQLLNPAMTGFTPADVRASLTYSSILPGYSSGSANSGVLAADAPVLKGKLPKGDALGIGMMCAIAAYDKSKAGGVSLSAAYHKALGKKRDQYLSLGLRAHTNTWYDEGMSSSTAAYHAGVMYTRPLGHTATVYGGYAVTAWFVPTSPMHIMYVGTAWNINSRIALYANATTILQRPSINYWLTAYASYLLNKDSKQPASLYVGGGYRYQNAIAPYVGIEHRGVRLGISYDININSFTPSGNTGIYEVSLMWLGRFKKQTAKLKDVTSMPRVY